MQIYLEFNQKADTRNVNLRVLSAKSKWLPELISCQGFFFFNMKVIAKYFLSRKYQNLEVQTTCNFSVFNNTLKSKVDKWKEILQDWI